MDREEFTADLEILFGRLLAPVEALETAELLEPMEAGKWSWKDMAAHIIFWDKVTVRALEAAYQGRGFDWAEYSDWDAQNRQAVEEFAQAPASRVINAWRVTHSALVESISRVPDDKLLENGEIPPWLLGAVLDHYRHHAQQVEAWAKTMRKTGGGDLPVLD